MLNDRLRASHMKYRKKYGDSIKKVVGKASIIWFRANPHLKLQIALTWTFDAITLLTNTIWLDLSALLDLDIPLLCDSFYHQNFKSPTVY